MPALIEEARAKVNLTLRVVGRRVDGYHDLESVVAFADCADRLTLDAGTRADISRPPGRWRRTAARPPDNLVLKAARLLGERVPDLQARRIHPRQGAAGRGRNRRRLGGCRRGAAAAGAAERACARRSAPDRGRATDRRRRAGLPRLARLRHDRRRRNAAAAQPAENAVRAGQSVRSGRDQGRVRRRSACGMANCWSAPPT